MAIRFEGGDEFEKLRRNAGKGGVNQLEVGFFDTAKYPDGTPVAEVAAANEFGVGVPERSFFRVALKTVVVPLRRILRRRVDPRRNIVDKTTAALMGEQVRNEVIDAITALRTPPNAPSTIKAKKSSNPLIDTGLMRASVTYEVK